MSTIRLMPDAGKRATQPTRTDTAIKAALNLVPWVLNLERARRLTGAMLVAAFLTAACSGGGNDEGGGTPLGDDAARTAILDQLLAQPEQGSGDGALRLPFDFSW